MCIFLFEKDIRAGRPTTHKSHRQLGSRRWHQINFNTEGNEKADEVTKMEADMDTASRAE